MKSRLLELDRDHVWHPYTQMSSYAAGFEPLLIERASGSRFYDSSGKGYIDANSSWWCAVLGHDHPRLVAALREQLARMPHVPLAGITHEPAALLAERLAFRAPAGLSRVFFSDNGSTAVEAALKLCLQYWHQNGRPERRRFVALNSAFHGETLGVTALGGVEIFRRPFASVVLDCVHLPPEVDGPERAFSALARLLERDAPEIAGVVLEPSVQAAGGMRFYDPALLRSARELCREHDVFLVADEVFTGFGRTGPFWGVENAGVVPDILCSAKGLSGGLLPFAATLTNERIFEGFLGDRERAFFYGHTFAGNPLGARVALEVLRVFDDEAILEHAAHKARKIAAAFAELGELDGVEGARSLGMIGALELTGSQGYLGTRGQAVYRRALELGAYLRPLGDTVYIAPPLNITDGDLDELLEIVRASVTNVLRGAGC
jgi:adenosylmethionine-8-amino-7-oxononanoate aminotransferase